MFPWTTRQETRFTLDTAKLGASCMATSGDRLAHMSTANAARDMDLLRQAVGDEKLSYVGYSYGTYLGATYAKLFPDTVRALVLDGTVEPAAYSGSDGDRRPLTLRMDQHTGGRDVLAEFHAPCAEAGAEACALAALGDPATVTEELLQGLKTAPVTLPLPDGTGLEVTYDVAVSGTFFSLYEPSQWPALAADLAAMATAQQAGTQVATVSAQGGSAGFAGWLRKEEYVSAGTSFTICAETAETRTLEATDGAVCAPDAAPFDAPVAPAARGAAPQQVPATELPQQVPVRPTVGGPRL